MGQDKRLARKDLILIARNLKENKSTCVVNNKLILKINYYKTK